MPVMRVHSVISVPAHFPWNFDDATQHAYRRALELRYRLVPYHYSLAHLLYKTSTPWIRLVYRRRSLGVVHRRPSSVRCPSTFVVHRPSSVRVHRRSLGVVRPSSSVVRRCPSSIVHRVPSMDVCRPSTSVVGGRWVSSCFVRRRPLSFIVHGRRPLSSVVGCQQSSFASSVVPVAVGRVRPSSIIPRVVLHCWSSVVRRRPSVVVRRCGSSVVGCWSGSLLSRLLAAGRSKL